MITVSNLCDVTWTQKIMEISFQIFASWGGCSWDEEEDVQRQGAKKEHVKSTIVWGFPSKNCGREFNCSSRNQRDPGLPSAPLLSSKLLH